MRAAGQDDRLRPPLQEGADQVLFARERIFGVAEQHLQSGGVKDLRHAANGVGEIRVVERGNEGGDEARAAGRKRPRCRVGNIADAPDDGQHPVPRLLGDGRIAFQGARNRHRRHPRHAGDRLHRDGARRGGRFLQLRPRSTRPSPACHGSHRIPAECHVIDNMKALARESAAIAAAERTPERRLDTDFPQSGSGRNSAPRNPGGEQASPNRSSISLLAAVGPALPRFCPAPGIDIPMAPPLRNRPCPGGGIGRRTGFRYQRCKP